jgi:hypothetical protein
MQKKMVIENPADIIEEVSLLYEIGLDSQELEYILRKKLKSS